ncbi:MAG: PLP-dependent aminotransferase family protein [Clostridia bacterium]|nr:PLP-dependent aminotransferase family protein [Clostridia bacterium]
MKQQKPAYLQLYETLRERITRGLWAYGDRLPSRRQTAREENLSVITVEHSYELLCQEGYIEARPRSGYYVIYRPADGFAEVSPTLPPPAAPVRYVSEQENAFPFSVLARTMRRVMTEYGETLLSKSPNTGCEVLRQAISRYLARNRGMTAAPEQIVIGSGAEYLYGLVVEMLGRNRAYAIESPSYEKIEQVYRAKGVQCDLLPLGQDGIQSTALSATSASVLHITPYRSFPSGVTASASKRREYIHWAEESDRFIVEDDFESEFSLLRKPEETVFSLSKKENVIYLNTFSRTVSPSIRVGYMVLPPRLIPLFSATVGFYSCTVPAFEQYVLSELMDNGDFERHVNRIRRMERKKGLGSRDQGIGNRE